MTHNDRNTDPVTDETEKARQAMLEIIALVNQHAPDYPLAEPPESKHWQLF